MSRTSLPPNLKAPTAKMCESDENYVPLNDGMSWKGDPNATLLGQDAPQLPPGSPSAVAPAPTFPALAVTQYDPVNRSYIAPDGNTYYLANLA